jgi:lipopolysaccharide export system ATP-binding protein
VGKNKKTKSEMQIMEKETPLLDVKNLKKSYEGRLTVKGLSFHVFPGEIVGLLGPNGAGKTTAFYITMGLRKPDSGAVYFAGEEITHLPIHKRALKGMGYLAQEPTVFDQLTVQENILIVLEGLSYTKKECKKKALEALKELRLDHLAESLAGVLSGGERRRLEIARVLISKPKLLLLDEPFANIDPKSIQEVKDLIKGLALRHISVLITDHNAREIFSIVDRSYIVCDGAVIKEGTVEELLQDEEAKARYLGASFSM